MSSNGLRKFKEVRTFKLANGESYVLTFSDISNSIRIVELETWRLYGKAITYVEAPYIFLSIAEALKGSSSSNEDMWEDMEFICQSFAAKNAHYSHVNVFHVNDSEYFVRISFNDGMPEPEKFLLFSTKDRNMHILDRSDTLCARYLLMKDLTE